MAQSPFTWVDNLHIDQLPLELQPQLNFICALTVLNQESTEEAEKLWNQTIFHDFLSKKIEMLDFRLRKLEEGESITKTLLISLFSISVAFPVSAILAEFAIVATSMLSIRRRSKSWKDKFHTDKLKKEGKPVPKRSDIEKKAFEEWERNFLKEERTIKNKSKPLRKLGSEISDSLIVEAISLLFGDNVVSEQKEAEFTVDDFWRVLEFEGDRMQDIVTKTVNDAHDLMSWEVTLIPEGVNYLESKAKSNFRDIKWLMGDIAKIRNGEKNLDDLVLRTWISKVAKERLASVWLLQFFALHLPVLARPKKFEANNVFRTKVGRPLILFRRGFGWIVPYKVSGRWFPFKLDWISDSHEALAFAILNNTKPPLDYLKTYLQRATNKVTVEPNIQQPASDVVYVSPKIEDAISEYAYYELWREILKIQFRWLHTSFYKIIRNRLDFFENRKFKT